MMTPYYSIKKVTGFTLVEVMVVIAILIGLAAIAYPTYVSITKNADQQACAGNLKGLYKYGVQYSDDHRSCLPCSGMEDDPDTVWNESEGWWIALTPYVLQEADRPQEEGEVPLFPMIFRCPSIPEKAEFIGKRFFPATEDNIAYTSWTDNSEDPSNPASGIQITRGQNLAQTPWLSDGKADSLSSIRTKHEFEGKVLPMLDHHGSINVLYADGAVRGFEGEEKATFQKIFPGGASLATGE